MSEGFIEPQDDAELIPIDAEVVSGSAALEELELALTPIDALDDDLVVIEDGDEDPKLPFGKGYAFDFQRHELARGREGRSPLKTFGEASLKTRIEKCLRTERGAHPIYSDDYGMEAPFDLIGAPLNSALSSDVQERVRGALVRLDDRIADVRDFSLDYDEQEPFLLMSFRVVLDDETVLSFDRFTLG